MSKNKKKKHQESEKEVAGEQAVEQQPENKIEELKKAIIQEAILLFKKERSSIVDLDNATKAYLDELEVNKNA
jgi:hypothetical protein